MAEARTSSDSRTSNDSSESLTDRLQGKSSNYSPRFDFRRKTPLSLGESSKNILEVKRLKNKTERGFVKRSSIRRKKITKTKSKSNAASLVIEDLESTDSEFDGHKESLLRKEKIGCSTSSRQKVGLQPIRRNTFVAEASEGLKLSGSSKADKETKESLNTVKASKSSDLSNTMAEDVRPKRKLDVIKESRQLDKSDGLSQDAPDYGTPPQRRKRDIHTPYPGKRAPLSKDFRKFSYPENDPEKQMARLTVTDNRAVASGTADIMKVRKFSRNLGDTVSSAVIRRRKSHPTSNLKEVGQIDLANMKAKLSHIPTYDEVLMGKIGEQKSGKFLRSKKRHQFPDQVDDWTVSSTVPDNIIPITAEVSEEIDGIGQASVGDDAISPPNVQHGFGTIKRAARKCIAGFSLVSKKEKPRRSQ